MALADISLLQDLAPPSKVIPKWNIIPIEKLTELSDIKLAHRLNSFGSSFYFGKTILRRRRLTERLHGYMCSLCEAWHLHKVIEWPRDFFKTTVYSEIIPMWWALPFNDEDASWMIKIGYTDEFIRWMRRAHDRNTRTLIVSEVEANAIKIGKRINNHYENNDFFKYLFPEIMPDTSCVWHNKSMTHKRDTAQGGDGEGTYDLIGVGGALQSRHYKRIVEDDLVGKEALKSEVVMNDTIDYHRLLPGAFDSSTDDRNSENDEVIVGNRWANNDLNAYIRENESATETISGEGFNIETHSALGGCCPMHPPEQSIFPEEWTFEKLMLRKKRFGGYFFSCQMLNNPTPPGETYFNPKWLNLYHFDQYSLSDTRLKLVHDVAGGIVPSDLLANLLQISMVVDPNHSQNRGRSRHAIAVTGVFNNPQRVYLLDYFAEACGFERFVDKIYELAFKWKLREFWLETMFGQKYLKFYLELKNKITGRSLRVNDLKSDCTADAKARRIEAMQPIFENGLFWMRRGMIEFETEYTHYPYSKTKDILDTVAYAPQTWKLGWAKEDVMKFMAYHKQMATGGRRGQSLITGY